MSHWSESVLVGSFAAPIKKFKVNGKCNGKFEFLGEVSSSGPSPSYIIQSPCKHFMYCTVETEDETTSKVMSFKCVDFDALEFEFLSMQPSGGGAPCFLSVDEGNQYLFSSNYFGGNVAVFPIEQSTGELLPMCQEISFDITLDPHLSFNRDSGHCHQTVHLERSKNILLCELGQNAVYTFEFQPQPGCKDHHEVLKQLNCWVAPPGSGPRHLVVHPSEEFVYVLSELSCTIIVLRMDPATGVITSQCALQNPTDQEPLQCHSTLREDERDSPPEEINSAEILLSPDSRFLYVSNRDVVVPCYNPIHNTEYGRKSRCSIAVFAVLDGGARVQLIQHVSPMGRHPRALTFLNRGSHLAVANKDEGYQSTKEGGNLVLFPIAPNTGLLTFDQAVVSEDICGITLTQPTWIHPLSRPI